MKGNHLMQSEENGISPSWNFDYRSNLFYYDEERELIAIEDYS